MSGSRLAALAAGLALVPAALFGSGGRVARGVDFARLVPPAGAVVEPYENAGYSVRFVDGAVEVAVDVAPLESRWPFAPPRAPAAFADRVGAIARQASAGAGNRYEAVAAVLDWIASNVRYELDRGQSQEPAAVLARRSGYCTGIARLAVAMLDALDIEAREVPGYRFESGAGNEGAPAQGFHRWVEVHYPDRGWVFSDPSASHQFVPATYLRLAAERLEIAPGQGRLLERRDGVEDVDLTPIAPASVRVRPNDARRGWAGLVLRLASALEGEAFLDGEGVYRSIRIDGGEGRFLGLAPGSYELTVRAGGKWAAHKRLIFRAPVLGELTIPSGRVPAAGGGMR